MTQAPRFNLFLFFFNDTATTEIYTLSLHDALPIHLPGAGKGCDTGAGVDGDPSDLVSVELALTGVNAGAQLEPERSGGGDERARALDCPRRPVEGREQAVPGRIDFLASEMGELAANLPVKSCQEVSPGGVAQLGRARGRANDVREEDGGEHAVGDGVAPGPGKKALQVVGKRLIAMHGEIGRRQRDALRVGNLFRR